MEAKGMPEAEATAESEVAATTREDSPAEGGGGPGTAGKAASLKSSMKIRYESGFNIIQTVVLSIYFF
jgi:hypothetical protein